MDNKTKSSLIEILGYGEERPLMPPDPIARLEYISRVLTEVADLLEKQAKANPDYFKTLMGYKSTQKIREQVLNLADVAMLIDTFFCLKEDDWMRFNEAYITNTLTED